MATKIYKRTMLNGREIMVKFGYADNNGEYYTRFADASHQNGGRGASYAAFIAYPADIPCWEMDDDYGFKDRALESWEKLDFVEDYLRSHPSKEAFDFMVDVQDELKRRCKDIGATVGGFDEDCHIFIKFEKDRQLICVHISFYVDEYITVMGCYNNHDVYQTYLDWSDAKAVIDEAWAAFDGLCQYRDYIHLPKMKGDVVSMDALKCEFNDIVYERMKASFRNYVEYVREITENFTIKTDKLPNNWGYKQKWRDLWVSFIENITDGDENYIRMTVWEAAAYYYYESYNGRFMCNDTVVKCMLPEFALENGVVYTTSSGRAANVLVYGNMENK